MKQSLAFEPEPFRWSVTPEWESDDAFQTSERYHVLSFFDFSQQKEKARGGLLGRGLKAQVT
ncbi:MAG: hypothetical protein P0120_01820 [Nitrospira sp.]|nr:hypothetical protein [Nitrospira sp.]